MRSILSKNSYYKTIFPKAGYKLFFMLFLLGFFKNNHSYVNKLYRSKQNNVATQKTTREGFLQKCCIAQIF